MIDQRGSQCVVCGSTASASLGNLFQKQIWDILQIYGMRNSGDREQQAMTQKLLQVVPRHTTD
jgi:hypothetical protein